METANANTQLDVQELGEKQERSLAKMEEATSHLLGMVENLHIGDKAMVEDMKYHLHILQSEQETFKARLARQKMEMAFYGSFDKLIYDTIQQPVSQAIDVVRSIVEQAERQAASMVEEAQHERDLILSKARMQAKKMKGAGSQAAASGQNGQPQFLSMFPTAPLHHQMDKQTELVVSGFKTFSQTVEFQKALMAISEVTHAKVRLVQRGMVNMEVRHEPSTDLAECIAQLPGFAFHVVAQEQGHLTLVLDGGATSLLDSAMPE
jgi:hypothetical protein